MKITLTKWGKSQVLDWYNSYHFTLSQHKMIISITSRKAGQVILLEWGGVTPVHLDYPDHPNHYGRPKLFRHVYAPSIPTKFAHQVYPTIFIS